MSEVLLEKIDEGVAVLTLNRPDKLNALNPSLMKGLVEAVGRMAQARDVHCVVLTGAGRGFCSGGDIGGRDETERQPQSEAGVDEARRQHVTQEERTDHLQRSMEAARLLHDMDKPTIAMINGPAAGAGLALAGACDLRFAAKSATFLSAFVRVGLSGDYGGSYFWTRILGTAKARELYLLSEKLTAEQALAMGLVTRIFEDASLEGETMAIAKRLANGPRAALRYIKRNLNAAENGTIPDVFALEAAHMTLSGLAAAAARKQQS